MHLACLFSQLLRQKASPYPGTAVFSYLYPEKTSFAICIVNSVTANHQLILTKHRETEHNNFEKLKSENDILHHLRYTFDYNNEV